MTTQSSEEKARKQAAHLQKGRQALLEAIKRDVQQLRKIIRGKSDKK
jgi:hypothetical protein